MRSDESVAIGAHDRVVVFGPIRWSDPDDPYAGDSFLISATAEGMTATRTVFMFRHDWMNLTSYFHDLADAWKGFEGERVFHSVEYDLEIRATSDQRGNNLLRFIVQDGPNPTWSAQLELDGIAAGEDTASIARQVAAWAGSNA